MRLDYALAGVLIATNFGLAVWVAYEAVKFIAGW
jgi:hypothetical protein